MSPNNNTVSKRCRTEGGLTQATLGELREEQGHKRLGRYVLEEIVERLTEQGLGYFPAWILDPAHNVEPRQGQDIWLYQRDNSPRSRVLEAVLRPESADVRGTLDAVFQPGTASLSAEQRLQRIRDIVMDD